MLNEVIKCPRCNSSYLKKIYNNKRFEGFRTRQLAESGEHPDVHSSIGIDVSIHCVDCHCLVHYRE